MSRHAAQSRESVRGATTMTSSMRGFSGVCTEAQPLRCSSRCLANHLGRVRVAAAPLSCSGCAAPVLRSGWSQQSHSCSRCLGSASRLMGRLGSWNQQRFLSMNQVPCFRTAIAFCSKGLASTAEEVENTVGDTSAIIEALRRSASMKPGQKLAPLGRLCVRLALLLTDKEKKGREGSAASVFVALPSKSPWSCSCSGCAALV